MLLFHWPNWRKISNIKEVASWSYVMHVFREPDASPNFIADVKKAHSHNIATHDNESDSENNNDLDPHEHPE